MDDPLGHMIGNSLEVVESIECLQGQGPADLEHCVCRMGKNIAWSSYLRIMWIQTDNVHDDIFLWSWDSHRHNSGETCVLIKQGICENFHLWFIQSSFVVVYVTVT